MRFGLVFSGLLFLFPVVAAADAASRMEFVTEAISRLGQIGENVQMRGVWSVKTNLQLQVDLVHVKSIVRGAPNCGGVAINLLNDLKKEGIAMLDVSSVTVYGLPQIQVTPFSDPERGAIYLSATTGDLIRVQGSPTEKCGSVSEAEPARGTLIPVIIPNNAQPEEPAVEQTPVTEEEINTDEFKIPKRQVPVDKPLI